MDTAYAGRTGPMRAVDDAIGRLARGVDVVVEGEPALAHDALVHLEGRLAPEYAAVRVAAPAAGLSLSGLIAELSGQQDLGGHDDAALEIGLRRLTAAPGSKPTVLLLDTAPGMSRSAFRFLRQVARMLPNLRFVVVAFAGMDDLLAETGMEDLRARLRIEPPLSVAAPAPETAPIVLPAMTLALPAIARRRPLLSGKAAVWTASAMGMAASLALGTWLGVHWAQPPTLARAELSDVAMAKAPLQPADTAGPRLAEAAPMPALAAGAAPRQAELALPHEADVAAPQTADVVAPRDADVAAPRMAKAIVPTVDTAAPSAPDRASTTAASDVGAPPPRAEAEAEAAPASRPALRTATEDRRRSPSRPNRVTTTAARMEPPHYFWADRRPGARWAEPDDETYAERPEPGPMPFAESGRAYGRRRGSASEWQGERAIGPVPGSYIGTYSAGPYGARVFSYQP